MIKINLSSSTHEWYERCVTVIIICRLQQHIMINRKHLQDPAAFIIVCVAVCRVHFIQTLHSCKAAFYTLDISHMEAILCHSRYLIFAFCSQYFI